MWVIQRLGLDLQIVHPLGSAVTIIAEPIQQGITLQEYSSVFLEQFKSDLVEAGVGEFEETSRAKIDDPASISIQGRLHPMGIYPPELVQLLITIRGENAFVAIAEVPDSLIELHQPILERMLDSLTFFEPSPPPADDHGNTPGTATEIVVGESIVGVVEAQGDIDYFKFLGVGGETYQAALELDDLNDALMFLRSDGGTCILTASIDYNVSGAPLIRWPIPADGTYYLSVENATGISTGAYVLSLETTSDVPTDDHGNESCSASVIDPGDEVSGIISEGVEVDWFRFQADAGTTYVIVVTLGTLDDSLLALWDTDGATVLEFNDDTGLTLASRIQWTAEQSGFYFLDVETPDKSSTNIGTYTLTITTQP